MQTELLSPGGHGILEVFPIPKCVSGKEKLPGMEKSGANGTAKILFSQKSDQATWSDRHNFLEATLTVEVCTKGPVLLLPKTCSKARIIPLLSPHPWAVTANSSLFAWC